MQSSESSKKVNLLDKIIFEPTNTQLKYFKYIVVYSCLIHFQTHIYNISINVIAVFHLKLSLIWWCASIKRNTFTFYVLRSAKIKMHKAQSSTKAQSNCTHLLILIDIIPLICPLMSRKNSCFHLGIWIHTNIYWVLSWRIKHPSSKFCGNPHSSCGVFMLTNKEKQTRRWKHNLLGWGNNRTPWCTSVSIFSNITVVNTGLHMLRIHMIFCPFIALVCIQCPIFH